MAGVRSIHGAHRLMLGACVFRHAQVFFSWVVLTVRRHVE